MDPKEFLMIPGPTPVPDNILSTMAEHPIGHRSKEFSKILMACTHNLARLANCDTDTFILTSSGTGAMETAIVNSLSPKDKVLSLVCGVFGERWAKICEAHNLEVERMKFTNGQSIDLNDLRKKLVEDQAKEIKAVTLTHNETSTGVLNELEKIAHIIKEHGALCIVDAITSFGAVPIEFTNWGIDILVAGSQKALMLPPGLATIFVSERFWESYESSNCPKFYFDLGRYKKSIQSETTPFTPNVSMISALKVALESIQTEGIVSIHNRHERMRKALRAGLIGMGLKPFVNDKIASPTITSIYPPSSISVDQIRRSMKEKYQIRLADGQEELKNRIFRIGHMGYVFERDILTTLACLESCLAELGHRCPSGIGVGSAITELANYTQSTAK